ncbi:MAG: lysylphosphatidylglycerol synthase domain-containing protein [Planctomycetota bacterium]|nr:lysylphosphatidylglycerol synthase domain-containing protein [Planctomycetota bacterium]
MEPHRAGGRLRALLQLLGFLAGIALFAWAIRLALSSENREALQRAWEAPVWLVGALVALTLASVVINGLIFWIALLPRRRLSSIDLVAVNSVAMLLSFLPFKLSALFRFFIHHRRDGVSIRDLLAWFGSVMLVALAALGPLALAGMLTPEVGGLWWLLVGGGVALSLGGCLLGGRMLAWAPKIDRMTLGASRLLQSKRAVLGQAALRFLDVAIHSGRFAAAAAILGAPLEAPVAVLLGTTYFLIGAMSPAGMLGAREGGLVILGALTLPAALTGPNVASMALMITATEVLVFIPAGGLGAIRLRLDRLLRGAHAPPSVSGHTDAAEA